MSPSSPEVPLLPRQRFGILVPEEDIPSPYSELRSFIQTGHGVSLEGNEVRISAQEISEGDFVIGGERAGVRKTMKSLGICEYRHLQSQKHQLAEGLLNWIHLLF